MHAYRIAEAAGNDLAAIVAIYNSTIAARCSTADLNPVSVAQKQAWFDAHGGSRPLYVVKDSAEEVAAWGGFGDYYPRAAYHITAEISIYVRHDLRGAGLGKILLRYMLEKAPSLGIRNIIAVVFGHNHASIRLFYTCGFEQWGCLPEVCDLDGERADVLLLGKKIVD
ncbi:MAG: GNAT family N-acetyltransferase [Neisseria sp.]|nr:GNAT family N-acetyltransferase [Neisseria sp.]